MNETGSDDSERESDQLEATIDSLDLPSKHRDEIKPYLKQAVKEYYKRIQSGALREISEREEQLNKRKNQLDELEGKLSDREKRLEEGKNGFKAAKELKEKHLRDEEKRSEEEKKRIQNELKKLETLSQEHNRRLKEFAAKEEGIAIREEKVKGSLEQIKAQWENIEKEKVQNNKDSADNLRRSDELDHAARELEKTKTIANEVRAETVELQKKFWPDCLLAPEWEDWRAVLQHQTQVDVNAAILLAALHMCYAAAKTDKTDLMYDALWQTGVNLLPRFAADAERLAHAFNKTANGRFQLRLPKQGQPTDSAWMNFKPGLSSVTEVFSWAVFDSEGKVRHRANVK